MKRILFFVVVLMLVFVSTSAFAQIPRVINYQGKLLDSNKQPVSDGEYEITFNLYDEADNLLWSEIHAKVLLEGGFFHVILGTVKLFDLLFDQPYFLGIQVGSDPELQPRMLLTSAPYSIRAEDANMVGGIRASDVPTPNSLVPLGSDGKFPTDVLPSGVSGDFLRKNEPDTSLTTTVSPLLLVSNLGDGDGINGRSANGDGISGRSENMNGIVGWTGASDRGGVLGFSTDGKGVIGRSDKNTGVVGWTGASDKSGVFGHSTDGIGVEAYSDNNNAMSAQNASTNEWIPTIYGKNVGAGDGVYGWSQNRHGVFGVTYSSNPNHAGIYAVNNGAGYAALFRGNVRITSKSTGATIIELGEGLDYAEGFVVSDKSKIEPGTVLIIDAADPGKLTVSDKPYDYKVAGIVTGAKGLGSGVRLGSDQFDYDVALAGRVYCNVDASYGEVSPGDLLTTSSTPGYAMVVKDYAKAQGAILGKAMEKLTQGKKGQILVLVTLQ